MSVSEISFGACGIGGISCGSAGQSYALRALARTEELGCNLVDTASVYGHSEAMLAEFRVGRRDKWLIATKYSGQEVGLEATLDRDPLHAKLRTIKARAPGVLVRPALREGFLTRKCDRHASFPDPSDGRQKRTQTQIAAVAEMAEKFRYLENDVGSMLVGAACYPLSSDETSTVAMGARTEHKAEINFGVVPGKRLSGEALQAVRAIQRRLRLHYRTGRMVDALKDTFPELSAPGRQTESSDIS